MEYEPNAAARAALAMQGPLADRLKIIAADFRARLVDYARAMDKLVSRLRDSDAIAGIPQIGEVFPDFILPDARGHLWRLQDALTHGPLMPITASFVLAPDGRVTARHVDPDPRLRIDGDAILQAASDFQLAARS